VGGCGHVRPSCTERGTRSERARSWELGVGERGHMWARWGGAWLGGGGAFRSRARACACACAAAL
jgi:hypothetical protein